jgi:hypothetical protein
MRRVTCLVLAAALLRGRDAFAGTFASDGTYAFAPEASFRLDFEGEALPPLTDPEAAPPEPVELVDALSGEHALKLGAYESVSFAVTLPSQLKTYRASVWVRGGEAVGIVGATYDGVRRDEASVLYPTGRMTSDGWVELANEHIPLDGARGPVSFGVFAPAGAEVDAFELVEDGETTLVPGRPCAGVSDTATCSSGEVCTWGACRRVSGWVPPIPAERDAVSDYLENRLEFLFGPYENRARDLPAAKVAIESMRHATDPWAFWNGFLLALRRLHDSHTGMAGSIAEYSLRNPRPIDACFLEGDADWSHEVAPRDPLYRDVLVSHVGSLRNLGLRSGDRLIRVDGRHPIDWARSMIDVSWSLGSASNHDTFAEHAAALRSLISRYARTLEVIRCTEQGCGAVETIDLLALAPLGPDEELSSQLCDNRPMRHAPGAPDNHQGADGVYAGFLEGIPAEEKLFGVEWDSLYTTTGQDGIGPALGKAVARIGSEAATGVVLDHRRGTGGTLAGPDIVWSYAVKRRPLTFFESRRRAEDEQPSLAAGKALFSAAVADGTVDYAGSKLAKPVPTALLITSDISASDWLPLGMKGADNVRLFGPYETNGAFSTRLALGYWLGMSFTLASGDTYVEDGRTINGFGVPPDEVVLPRQSDLARGRDTVFEAALAWLRAKKEAAP